MKELTIKEVVLVCKRNYEKFPDDIETCHKNIEHEMSQLGVEMDFLQTQISYSAENNLEKTKVLCVFSDGTKIEWKCPDEKVNKEHFIIYGKNVNWDNKTIFLPKNKLVKMKNEK